MISLNGFKDSASEFSSVAYQDIGEFYLAQKENSKASGYLSRALDIDPGDATLSRVKDIVGHIA